MGFSALIRTGLDYIGLWAVAETEGFEPSIRFRAYDDLANRCLQPLGHVSPNQLVGTL